MIIFWLTCLVGYPRTSAPEPISTDIFCVSNVNIRDVIFFICGYKSCKSVWIAHQAC